MWESEFALTENEIYCNNTTYFIPNANTWLLAVLNSPLIWWYSWRTAQHAKDEALRFFSQFVEALPIAVPRGPHEEAARSITSKLIGATDERAQIRSLLFDWLKVEHGVIKPSKRLDDLSFSIEPGELVALLGPNGAGKSTALNLIGGFYKPDSGTVRLGDADISGLSSNGIAQAGIARTYQTTQLFAAMPVIDNVLVAIGRGRLGWWSMFSPDRDTTRRALAESLLAFVGYRGALEVPAGALPHVDKRLVEIARALALQPDVLLLDEPAAGLDGTDTTRIGTLLRQLAGFGIVVILVEHDMKLVMGVSNHVVVLDAGQKIAEGLPAAVAADPAVLKAYLGEGAGADRARGGAAPDRKDELLLTRGLSAGYGAVNVLRDIVVTVAQGEMVAVLGPNGAGKSTLMRALSGLGRPVDGDIRFVGGSIEKLDASKIAAQGLILVPEGRQVFGELSVMDNLLLGAYARADADAASRAETMLTRFPRLRERANQRAGLLSGGEQQMLAIARGLMARPRLLMLDEPSLGLAPKLVEDLFDLMAQLRDEGVTLLLVDQAVVMALSVADRAYVLQSGSIAHSGSAAELRSDPALAKSYLGEHGGATAGKIEAGLQAGVATTN